MLSPRPSRAEVVVEQLHRLLSAEPIRVDAALQLALQQEIHDRLTSADTLALFRLAVENGSAELLQALLQSDLPCSDAELFRRVLRIIVDEGDAGLATAFLTNECVAKISSLDDAQSPLLRVAAAQDNAALVAALLQSRALDVDASDAAQGDAALHVAVEWDSVAVQKLLLRAGATVGLRTRDGLTPLHLAVYHGHTESVVHLVEAGAELATTDATGATQLHTAAREGHTELIGYLVQRGANLHARDVDGRTPLHVAAFYDESAARFARGENDTQVTVMKMLLAHGADADSRDGNCDSALHTAQRDRFDMIVDVLMTHRRENTSAA